MSPPIYAIEVLHGGHVACQEQFNIIPMGQNVHSNAKHFYCSRHATWPPCKTSIEVKTPVEDRVIACFSPSCKIISVILSSNSVLHAKHRTHKNDMAPNVWLHSSAGRASCRYSRRSRVRMPLNFFQASFPQLHKLVGSR